MKEFAMKHPILSFLLADAAIGGVVKTIQAICGIFGNKETTTTINAEVSADESADSAD